MSLLPRRIVLGLAPTFLLACAGGEIPVEDGTTSSSGGGGSTAETTSSSGGGGAAQGGGGSAEGGAGGAGGTGGSGGAGGSGPTWPTCDTQPPGSPTKTLPQIWQDDPATFAEAWVPGVYVTAVSGAGCAAGQACQIFVQQQESYASLAAATHQSLRIAIAPSVASYFTGISVGDRVDLYAHAIRDLQDGKNELFFLVTETLPGCAKVVGSGTSLPVTVTLDQLTVAAYEDTIGPVLVRVDTVTGNPNTPPELFALWDTGTMPNGDITTVTSLSPYFLAGGQFTGLTDGQNTDFQEVVGVFGLFVPPVMPVTKYEAIYVRTTADYPLAN